MIPRHGQAFGQDPPPPLYTVSATSQQQLPGPSSAPPSFDQATLIGALMDLSMGGQSGPWIADFGASAHLSATHGNLSSSRPVFNHAPVIVGNGSHLPISHLGQPILPSLHRPLYLHHVLVALDIVQNLLSVNHFITDNLLSMKFDPFGVSVKDLRTGALLLRCNSDIDLYPLFPPASSPSSNVALATTSSLLWHYRLGH
jgi:hypothetical protein